MSSDLPSNSSQPPEHTAGELSLLQQLADMLALKLIKKYRVEQARASAMVLREWAKKQELLQLIESSKTLKSVIRTRLYKDAERETTRKIYYELRRYQSEQDVSGLLQSLQSSPTLEAKEEVRVRLVENHVSTAERLGHIDEFWSQLQAVWGTPNSILDVGCGLLPLVFPFQEIPVSQYRAIDKSQDSVDTIAAFKQAYSMDQLTTAQWAIQQGWAHVAPEGEMFDVALLLKLVPVVARQEPDSLAILAQTPARRLIVTGCKTAMVKQRDISRREKTIILEFARQYHLQQVDEFETQDEVGVVLAKPEY